MPGVFYAAENAAWASDSVTLVIISFWKLQFLAYVLNVTTDYTT